MQFSRAKLVPHQFKIARSLALVASIVVLIGAEHALAVTYIQGFDVYTGDGAVNYTTAKNAGYSFAFVKCDEGVSSADAQFAANMSNANAAGVYVGPYHFAHTESLSPAGTVKFDNYTGGAFSPTASAQVNRDAYTDATLEAVDFITKIKPYYYQTGTTHYLPPVSDIEQAFMPNLTQSLKTQFVSNWAQLFSDTVLNAIGRTTLLDRVVQRYRHDIATSSIKHTQLACVVILAVERWHGHDRPKQPRARHQR
jgi:hypothetical protein